MMLTVKENKQTFVMGTENLLKYKNGKYMLILILHNILKFSTCSKCFI